MPTSEHIIPATEFFKAADPRIVSGFCLSLDMRQLWRDGDHLGRVLNIAQSSTTAHYTLTTTP